VAVPQARRQLGKWPLVLRHCAVLTLAAACWQSILVAKADAGFAVRMPARFDVPASNARAFGAPDAARVLRVQGKAATQGTTDGDGWGTVTRSSPKKPHATPTPPAAAAAGTSARAAPARVDALRATVTGDATRTTFALQLSGAIKAEIVTLANPYRVIIDMPDVAFRLPPGTGKDPRGLITAFRFGLFAEGKARVVIDASGPVLIERAELVASAKVGSRTGETAGELTLEIDLVPTDAATYGSGTGASRGSAGAGPGAFAQPAASSPPASPPASASASAQPSVRARPLIMIDPGHGGIDPGAVGGSNLYEKTVVLAVARQVRAALAAGGRFDVVMTRQSDVFVSLDQRLRLSSQYAPDLFVSLHADSIEARSLTQVVRGASVYTLSERASDDLARRMAEKENASDLIAGIDAAEGEAGDQLRSILIDLMKRETSNFSAEFSRLLIGSLTRSVPMSRDPVRAAAFKVLKQAGCPSVLVELGYMSNPDDERMMMTADWQRKVALSIAAAVESYFSRRGTAGR